MIPFCPEKITAAKSVIPAIQAHTAANLESGPSSAIRAAAAESPTPITTITDATNTGGSKVLSQLVPAILIIPATAKNTQPATTTPDKAVCKLPVAAVATIIGLMNANELPK